MVEITSEEQNKVKGLNKVKRTEDGLRDLWDNVKHTNIRNIGVPEEEKNKAYEKIFEEMIVENVPSGKGNSQSSPRGTKNPTQDKLKEKHVKTHTNQSN